MWHIKVSMRSVLVGRHWLTCPPYPSGLHSFSQTLTQTSTHTFSILCTSLRKCANFAHYFARFAYVLALLLETLKKKKKKYAMKKKSGLALGLAQVLRFFFFCAFLTLTSTDIHSLLARASHASAQRMRTLRIFSLSSTRTCRGARCGIPCGAWWSTSSPGARGTPHPGRARSADGTWWSTDAWTKSDRKQRRKKGDYPTNTQHMEPDINTLYWDIVLIGKNRVPDQPTAHGTGRKYSLLGHDVNLGKQGARPTHSSWNWTCCDT